MNRLEQELLARTYANADSVFEWGMGLSALVADRALMWVGKVRKMLTHTAKKYKFIQT